MFRYVACIWKEQGRETPAKSVLVRQMKNTLQGSSSAWQTVFDSEGVLIMAADLSGAMGAHRLHNVAGVVVGAIFERHQDADNESPARRAVFGERATEAVVASRGHCLTSDYWGNYVAFVLHPGDGARYIVKDPTGSLPCYFSEHSGVQLVFSCLADCREIGLRFHLNWEFLRRRVVDSLYEVESNPFAEIQRVHRGEGIRFNAEGACISRSFYWHPCTYQGAADLITVPAAAARALRATVMSCVHSLASAHASVLQQTSGGLDSSVVLGCLDAMGAEPLVTCYTDYIENAVCDERRWARYAAGSHRHIEFGFRPGEIDLSTMPVLAPSVDPESSFEHWHRGPRERQLAAEYAASAVFSGDGGDAVFCNTSYMMSVDHCIRRYGLGSKTFRMAALVAARRDQTVWNILGQALRRHRRGTAIKEHRASMMKMSALVPRDVVDSAADSLDAPAHFPNPWFSASSQVPLEDILRLGMLAHPPSFYDLSTSQHDPAPLPVAPLHAQPVFEVARRIPVDIHFDLGRKRGLARRAFSDVVPAPILRRQWKDRPLSQGQQVVQHNLRYIRDLLLDGHLVKARILDRDAVELALRNEVTVSRAFSDEVLQRVDLELWVRMSMS
jgi:asparagine synthase (glutamine-hydrolysing)